MTHFPKPKIFGEKNGHVYLFFQVFLIFGSSKEGWILTYSEFNLFWYAVLVEVYEDYPTSHVGS